MARKLTRAIPISRAITHNGRPTRSLEDEIHLTTLGYHALVHVVCNDGSRYDFPAFSCEHASTVLKTHANIASYAIASLRTSETTVCIIPITTAQWGQLVDARLQRKIA